VLQMVKNTSEETTFTRSGEDSKSELKESWTAKPIAKLDLPHFGEQAEEDPPPYPSNIGFTVDGTQAVAGCLRPHCFKIFFCQR
jgi:hypothetical protein